MSGPGGNSHQILYHRLVVTKDIPKLSPDYRLRVKRIIEYKLITKPEIFGKPLRRSLKGYRKLRVGDYRIVFKIENQIIFVLLIKHRSTAYKEILKRILR